MNTQGREGGGVVTHFSEEVNGEANGCADPSLATCYSLTGYKQWDSLSSQPEASKLHPLKYVEIEMTLLSCLTPA